MFQRVQHPVQRMDNLIGPQSGGRTFDRRQKVRPVDPVHRHVGGAIVLKDLMDLDDVGMVKLRQVHRFLHEQRHDRPEFVLPGIRPRMHTGSVAAADGAWKALFHHHPPVKRVSGKVGDPEATSAQKGVDGKLPKQKPGAGLQLVGEGFAGDSVQMKGGRCHQRSKSYPCNPPKRELHRIDS